MQYMCIFCNIKRKTFTCLLLWIWCTHIIYNINNTFIKQELLGEYAALSLAFSVLKSKAGYVGSSACYDSDYIISCSYNFSIFSVWKAVCTCMCWLGRPVNHLNLKKSSTRKSLILSLMPSLLQWITLLYSIYSHKIYNARLSPWPGPLTKKWRTSLCAYQWNASKACKKYINVCEFFPTPSHFLLLSLLTLCAFVGSLYPISSKCCISFFKFNF